MSRTKLALICSRPSSGNSIVSRKDAFAAPRNIPPGDFDRRTAASAELRNTIGFDDRLPLRVLTYSPSDVCRWRATAPALLVAYADAGVRFGQSTRNTSATGVLHPHTDHAETVVVARSPLFMSSRTFVRHWPAMLFQSTCDGSLSPHAPQP